MRYRTILWSVMFMYNAQVKYNALYSFLGALKNGLYGGIGWITQYLMEHAAYRKICSACWKTSIQNIHILYLTP